MNEAIDQMIQTPGVHYVTDPDAIKKNQSFPVWVDDDGYVYQLFKGNQRGPKIDPNVFREDAIVLRERHKGRRKLGA